MTSAYAEAMTRPFSERVADPEWRRAATEWIAEALGDRRVVEVEQPRIRPWSTQLKVATDAGTVWFKANGTAGRHEPRQQQLLAERLPDAFDAPLAIDADRGWMLTEDRGATWGDRSDPGLEQWCELVVEAARVQQELVTEGDVLRGLGVPDCSPATVTARFDRFVEVMAGLPDHHPSRVPPELRVRLEQRRSALADAVVALQESRLPTTWQHGDLHPWNVFVVGDRLRLFDLGDAQWAHPLEVLSVPFGWITERTELPWEPVAEAYADAWGVATGALAADWQAVGLTQAVNRVLTWWVSLAEATGEEWQEWGDAPLYHLSRVLDA